MKRNWQGQTLVETMVTVLFIAIGVLALVRFQNYLGYDNNFSQQKSEATRLAIQKIENLRDFQVLNNTSGYTSYQSIATGTSTTVGSTATYTISWTVTSNTNPTYKVADVRVTWTDRNNNSQSVRVVSDIAGIDPQYSAAII